MGRILTAEPGGGPPPGEAGPKAAPKAAPSTSTVVTMRAPAPTEDELLDATPDHRIDCGCEDCLRGRAALLAATPAAEPIPAMALFDYVAHQLAPDCGCADCLRRAAATRASEAEPETTTPRAPDGPPPTTTANGSAATSESGDHVSSVTSGTPPLEATSDQSYEELPVWTTARPTTTAPATEAATAPAVVVVLSGQDDEAMSDHRSGSAFWEAAGHATPTSGTPIPGTAVGLTPTGRPFLAPSSPDDIRRARHLRRNCHSRNLHDCARAKGEPEPLWSTIS